MQRNACAFTDTVGVMNKFWFSDIFSACFGRSGIDRIVDDGGVKTSQPASAVRIDPKFVNNPELSDVQFRVEGRTYYAHKLVLVTASSRFSSMLASR